VAWLQEGSLLTMRIVEAYTIAHGETGHYRAQPPEPAPALAQFVTVTLFRPLSSVIKDAVPQYIYDVCRE
jgi:hypothetical protein